MVDEEVVGRKECAEATYTVGKGVGGNLNY